MQEFKVNDHITIECRVYETRYSWGHKAKLYIDGEFIKEFKAVYYNRTWEAWQYASLLSRVADYKGISLSDRDAIKKYLGERN